MTENTIICILHNQAFLMLDLFKFNVGLKSLLHQGLSDPEFYGDLVYKFKKIRGMTDFSDQFRKLYCVTNVLVIIKM